VIKTDERPSRRVRSPYSDLWRIVKVTLAISHAAALVFVVGSHISDGITNAPTERSLAPLDLVVGFSVLGAPWSLVVYPALEYLRPDDAPSAVARLWLVRLVLSLGIATLLNVALLWWWALRRRTTVIGLSMKAGA
jgi:hypothetical protein